MDLAERVRRGRDAIASAKRRGMDTSTWQRHLQELLDGAGPEPDPDEGFEPWMLKEWRRVSRPQWRGILQESLARGDKEREEYARWMLAEVLLDPLYEDPPEAV